VVSATGGVELTSLASTARVTCSMSSLMGTSEWNPGPSFVTGRHSPHMAFHCSLTRLPADAQAVPETNLGGPLASPRWRFCGHGSRLGSNEKVSDDPVCFEADWARAAGAHPYFSPLALFDVRRP